MLIYNVQFTIKKMKRVVTDVFETLGGVATGTVKQAVSDVKKGGEEIAKAVGLKPDGATAAVNETPPAQTEEQYQKIKNAAENCTTARYKQIQEEIRQLQVKRERELPKQTTGKPGFDEGKAVKQLEMGGVASTEVSASQSKKPPPLAVQRATKKTEMFRGASG